MGKKWMNRKKETHKEELKYKEQMGGKKRKKRIGWSIQ